MPIHEKSFRIGCGRYVQEPGVLRTCGEEIRRLGRAPLIVGGKTALQITRSTIEKSVSAACESYRLEEYGGTCNDEYAREMAELAAQEGYDVIVGVGGGVIMDLAKLIASFAALPVINIPTSSATCAAYTPLSVRYTPEGRTVGSMHHQREVDAVLVDTSVMSDQPPRLLLAGVFDALAKFVEIKQRYGTEGAESPLGLDWAYVLSGHSYEELCGKTRPCLEDMRRGEISDTVERVIFTAIAATGVISGIARGSNQCALAHKFYEATRFFFHEASRPYLHGEIVGVGLLLQNAFNGEAENNRDLLALMAEYGMPRCLGDIGVDATKENLELYYDKLRSGSAVNGSDAEECARLRASLEYLWRLR
ncbi:MAG: iron-containing alcohol dehydrogenase [Clostridia bacterium]|nr:iron-containing alcohol dehydrogenase [Clostridia bacterium]